jgi:membrane associated rhomboid family serine protease
MLPLRDNIPTSRTPYVTYALIIANILVYFFWQKGGITLGDPSSPHYICQLQDWAAIPYEVTHPGDQVQIAQGCGKPPDAPTYLTIFTAMFMHGGLLHLGGNMLFLWIFGNNVEDSMGPVKFLIFYLLAGVSALALQVVIDPSSQVPTLGASGAIAGVLGGYLLLFPRARVVTVIFIVFFFTILELPALLVLGFWFLQQALFGYFDLAQPSGQGGGVAYFAHIGGFVFGLAAVRLFSSRRRVDDQTRRMGLPRR